MRIKVILGIVAAAVVLPVAVYQGKWLEASILGSLVSAGILAWAGSRNRRFLIYSLWMFGLSALLLIVLAGWAWHRSSTALPRLIATVSRSTVVIETRDGNGNSLGSGSGFFVDPSTVITNQHVVLGANEATVTVVGTSESYIVEGLLAIDHDADVAALKIFGAHHSSLALHVGSQVPTGTRVVVVGSPLGLTGSASEGIVSAVRAPDQRDGLQISAAISPGSSGGPVVLQDGEVVGVVRASRTAGQNLNFAIPAAAVQRLLSSKTPVRKLITASLGLGNDQERMQLFGRVRMVTVFPSKMDIQGAEALVRYLKKEFGSRATLGKLEDLTRDQVFLFDEEGRLTERSETDGSRTSLQYHQNGRLKSEMPLTHRGEVGGSVVSYVQRNDGALEAVKPFYPGSRNVVRRLEFDSHRRLTTDEEHFEGGTRFQTSSLRWVYFADRWPLMIVTLPANYPISDDDQIALHRKGATDALGNLRTKGAGDFVYELDANDNWVTKSSYMTPKNSQRYLLNFERRRIDYF